MRILVASGSFKDLYQSDEACRMIAQCIPNNNDIVEFPFCDGGEYTFDLLLKRKKYRIKELENIANPYGQYRKNHYLIDGKVAHIVASEVLRLNSYEEEYKNPLNLTDYGLGQLLLDAINSNFENIFVYIGGTSTVSLGVGLIQALGAVIFDENEKKIDEPIVPKQYKRIKNITIPEELRKKIRRVNITVVCDGNARVCDMEGINRLKIGKNYLYKERHILEMLDENVQSICKLFETSLDDDYTGTAGGLRLGIDYITNAKYVLGGDYFSGIWGLDDEIKKSDIVITGEGRLDNSYCGKTPGYIAKKAKEYDKQVIYCCGAVDDSYKKHLKDGLIFAYDDTRLEKMGITKVVTCQSYYDQMPDTRNDIDTFRKYTPEIMKKLLGKEFR